MDEDADACSNHEECGNFCMGSPVERHAFIVQKELRTNEEAHFARTHSDPIEMEQLSVSCEYTSAAVNPRPQCISVQRFHNAGRPQMLAYGSGRAVCLALEVNGDLRVFKTLAGHKDTVTCVAWVDSYMGPTFSRFKSLLISASADGK